MLTVWAEEKAQERRSVPVPLLIIFGLNHDTAPQRAECSHDSHFLEPTVKHSHQDSRSRGKIRISDLAKEFPLQIGE
jgi:hypothetical protein